MSRLTYTQVAAAITAKLQAQFPSIVVLEEDVEEGSANAGTGYKFIRPSFKATFETASSNEGQYNAERAMTCRILFFPTDLYRYSLEFLDIQDGLENAFGLNIPVMDRVLTINDSDNQVMGGGTQLKYLEFTFRLEWFDEPTQPPTGSNYTIEELDLNLTE